MASKYEPIFNGRSDSVYWLFSIANSDLPCIKTLNKVNVQIWLSSKYNTRKKLKRNYRLFEFMNEKSFDVNISRISSISYHLNVSIKHKTKLIQFLEQMSICSSPFTTHFNKWNSTTRLHVCWIAITKLGQCWVAN